MDDWFSDQETGLAQWHSPLWPHDKRSVLTGRSALGTLNPKADGGWEDNVEETRSDDGDGETAKIGLKAAFSDFCSHTHTRKHTSN